MSHVRDPEHSGDGTVEATQLQARLIAFVRAFGLLRPDATPCGQPLSVSEAHALLELSRDAGLSQATLGERLRLEKSTVSRLVTQLQGRGWAERARDPTDRRAMQLHLTTSGRRIADQVAAARADHYATLLERIPPGERESVLHALEVLVQALPGGDEDEGDGTLRGDAWPAPSSPATATNRS